MFKIIFLFFRTATQFLKKVSVPWVLNAKQKFLSNAFPL